MIIVVPDKYRSLTNDRCSQMCLSWPVLFIFVQMISTIHLLPLKHAVRSKETVVSLPSTKSNSIELLKKVFAHRRRLMNTHRSSTAISNFSAKITIEPHCVSIYVQPALYESYRRQYVGKETSSPLPILTLLQTAPLPSLHGRQRRMTNHQTLYPFCFSTVLSVLCSSRWCSSFFCGKTSRRRKRSDGCFSFEFYSRQQITIAYLKLPCLTTKRSRDSTPLSYSSLHGEYQRGLAHVETGLE